MQRLGHFALVALEIVILSALILAARCANYRNVFIAGNVYFTDADCYARMTRVTDVRRAPRIDRVPSRFRELSDGTTPHTTAPLAGWAIISPLLGLLGGWFFWWWACQMRFRFRWPMLLLYAISPILVHGSELGRPDHQSLLILLVTIGLCAEWILQTSRHADGV